MHVEVPSDVVRLFDSIAPIKIRAAQCEHCGSIVYSRCGSDKRTCMCGGVSISGGITPQLMTTTLPERIKWIDIVIDKDLNDMYYDWLLNVDRFGLITPRGTRRHVTAMKYVWSMSTIDGEKLYEKAVIDA